MQQELAKKVGDDVVISVPQTVQYLSPPMMELEAALAAGRVHHDGDPVLAWAMSCVLAKRDAKGNVFPRKLENGTDKIDPATAFITGMNRAMVGQVRQRSVYATRGILTL
jgi:phage terminase large subunit-like protein